MQSWERKRRVVHRQEHSLQIKQSMPSLTPSKAFILRLPNELLQVIITFVIEEKNDVSKCASLHICRKSRSQMNPVPESFPYNIRDVIWCFSAFRTWRTCVRAQALYEKKHASTLMDRAKINALCLVNHRFRAMAEYFWDESWMQSCWRPDQCGAKEIYARHGGDGICYLEIRCGIENA